MNKKNFNYKTDVAFTVTLEMIKEYMFIHFYKKEITDLNPKKFNKAWFYKKFNKIVCMDKQQYENFKKHFHIPEDNYLI